MTEQDSRWHLDRKVPISIVLVIMMQGVAGIWMIAEIKKDVELLKAAQLEQHQRDDRQDKSTTEAVNQFRADIQEIGRKLDRLIERGTK